jgi:hypothetical protein
MNYQTVEARKWRKAGVYVATIEDRSTGELYWTETVLPLWRYPTASLPPPKKWHGPFKTEAEVEEHQRLTLLGDSRIKRRSTS